MNIQNPLDILHVSILVRRYVAYIVLIREDIDTNEPQSYKEVVASKKETNG